MLVEIIRGLPGIGKTSRARNIDDSPPLLSEHFFLPNHSYLPTDDVWFQRRALEAFDRVPTTEDKVVIEGVLSDPRELLAGLNKRLSPADTVIVTSLTRRQGQEWVELARRSILSVDWRSIRKIEDEWVPYPSQFRFTPGSFPTRRRFPALGPIREPFCAALRLTGSATNSLVEV